jgi:hypothetical protein
MAKTSELVWLYVKRRPFLMDFLRSGTVNYSALARSISSEAFGGKAQNAVKMALIRLSTKMDKEEAGLAGRIRAVLRKSSLVAKSKVAVVIAKRELPILSPLSVSRSGRNVTYIVEERELERLKDRRAVWKIEENMNLITIESPEELEEVPGVISYILGALASEGINVVEFISCYTDTLLVVQQSDTESAFRILNGVME